MWELITRLNPETPFRPRPYNFNISGNDLSGWTYGHYLLDGDTNWQDLNVLPRPSLRLRRTVAWCMEHFPSKRPSMENLGPIIQHGLTREYGQTDEEICAWVGRAFGEAPSPSQ